MGKFIRLSNKTDVPDYINQAFFPETEVATPDLYAELRKQAAKNQAIIDREILQNGKDTIEKPENAWEELRSASVYQNAKFSPEDSAHSIRRSQYDIDEELMVRSPKFAHTLLDPDADQLENILTTAMSEENSLFDKRTTREMRAARHEEWESEQLSAIRPVLLSSARANPLIKISMETSVESKFGMPNYEQLCEQEESRIKSLEESRTQRKAIRANRQSAELKHQIWQDNIQPRAVTVQDQQGDWMSQYLNSLEKNS